MQALWMLLASLSFATMGMCVKYASAYFNSAELVCYRGLIGVALMWAVARCSGVSLATSRPAMHAWRAVVGVLALGAWFYAIAHLPLATAMTLNYMSSLWVAAFLLSAAWFKADKLLHSTQGQTQASTLGACRTWGVDSENRPQQGQFAPTLQPHSGPMGQKGGEKWAAAVDLQPTIRKSDRLLGQQMPLAITVLAGFVGVVLLLRPTLEQEQAFAATVGLSSGLLAALAYLQVTALGRLGEPESRTVFYFALGSCLAGALGMAVTGISSWSWHGALWLLPIGVLASLGQWCMTRAYGQGATLVVSSLQYSGIVFGALYGVALFGDSLPWVAWAGMALILVSGVLATLLRSSTAPSARSA